jgi:hypothetical protein
VLAEEALGQRVVAGVAVEEDEGVVSELLYGYRAKLREVIRRVGDEY